MEEELNILVPYGYEEPTEESLKAAKKWTLQRNEASIALSSLIEEILRDTAKKLTQIAYKYNCKPEDFQFSQDKDLREEVAKLMSDIEDKILELIENYSLSVTEDKERRNNLLPWILALHSKDSKDLKWTLRTRLTQFLFDTEAQIAAMKLANYEQTKAITRILSTIHTVYSSPEILAAFKKKSAARYIKTKGVHDGNIGLSSSGAVNVENFARTTLIMAWSHEQYEEAMDDGKAGFFVFRGSQYPCDLCDSKVGFHLIDDNESVPPFHARCCCFVVYVNKI